jgi:hypothetical protein
MPERKYMIVDRRHDHSFRIPRPDQSAKLGTPNACNDCHTDKPAQWAASAVETWYGPQRKGFQTYGEAFHSAWTGQLMPKTFLVGWHRTATSLVVARASALTALSAYLRQPMSFPESRG